MKILDTIWFSSPQPGIMGVVLGEDDVTGERKAYIGFAMGNNQDFDAEYIARSGGKFHPASAQTIMKHFGQTPTRDRSDDLMTMLGRWIMEKDWFAKNCPERDREQAKMELRIYERMSEIFQGVLKYGLSPELPGNECSDKDARARAEGEELQAAPPDARIAYGVRCTWWDSISQVGLRHINGHNLPCCPRCGGMLLEVANEEIWQKSAEGYAGVKGWPDYPKFLNWLRGRCYPSFETAEKDFKEGDSHG